MDPTEQEIRNFQEAWHKDFGEELTPERARTELVRLLTFLQILYDHFYGPDRDKGSERPGMSE